jgi:hypothetical protein
MGQARIGEMRLLAKLSSPCCVWFGDGGGSSAFNIHMLGEGEVNDGNYGMYLRF